MKHLAAAAVWMAVGLSVVILPAASVGQRPAETAAPESLYNEAAKQLRAGDVDGAVAKFRRLADQYPRSPRAPQALLIVARAQHERRDLAEAKLIAERLVADYARAPQAAGGLVLLAAMRTSTTAAPEDFKREREQLRRVAAEFDPDRFPRLAWRAEARVREGDLGLRLGEHAEAAAAFVAVIEEEPPSRWTSRAQLGLGRTLLVERRWLEAADVLQRLVTDGAQADAATHDPQAVESAKRLLTSIHRLHLRPLAAQSSWPRARKMAIRGVKLKDATGLAVSADGRLLLADSAAGKVYLVGTDGSVIEDFRMPEPGHPTWAPSRPFWSNRDSRPCLAGAGRFQCPGDEAGASTAPGGAGAAWAAARGPMGRWYLIDRESGRVRVWGAAGDAQPALQATEAIDVAVDLRGKAYVLDGQDDRVSRFGPSGAREGTAATHKWRRPEAVEVDLLERVYVLDRREKRVDIFNAEGGRLTPIGPRLPNGIELRRPIDLAIDEEARLYILDTVLEAVIVLE